MWPVCNSVRLVAYVNSRSAGQSNLSWRHAGNSYSCYTIKRPGSGSHCGEVSLHIPKYASGHLLAPSSTSFWSSRTLKPS